MISIRSLCQNNILHRDYKRIRSRHNQVYLLAVFNTAVDTMQNFFLECHITYIICAKLNQTKGLIWELRRSSESLSTSKSTRHSRVGQVLFISCNFLKKSSFRILMILAGCRFDFQPFWKSGVVILVWGKERGLTKRLEIELKPDAIG